MSLFRLVCLVLPFTLAIPALSAAQGKAHRAAKDQVLRDFAKLPETPRVIVRYRPGAKRGVAQRLAARGARVLHDHQGIGAFTVELPRAAVDHMAADPDVWFLSTDAPVSVSQTQDPATTATTTSEPATTTTTEPSTTDTSTTEESVDTEVMGLGWIGTAWTTFQNLLAGFDAQQLRATLGVRFFDTGNDVGVAIIDSGISPSPDLANRIFAFYDFTQGGIAAAPSDEYGHGTHIAGLIAGNGSQSSGKYMGVATRTRLIGLKVLDAQGRGYTSNVIAALDFATVNRATLRIDVINLSLGHPIFEPATTDPLVLAVERAVKAGIVVVVSAGNHGMNPVTGQIGYAGITSPGNAPNALTVGSLRTKATATRLDDEVSMFSSRGPTWYDGRVKPDLIAPGQALIAVGDSNSTLYQNTALRADVAPYIRLSGTSMAAAVASGVVALVIDANRADEGPASVLTPNTVKAILQYTAIPVTDPDPTTPVVFEQGAGGLNAAGAMALTRSIDPEMPLASTWIEYGVSPMSYLGDSWVNWVQHIVWGDHLVWGDTIAWNLKAWAAHIVWGADDDGHIVWGDNEDQHIVWGDAFTRGVNEVLQFFSVWSTHIVWGDSLSVVRSTSDDGHIVWGDLDDGHIVWGDDDEHVVWGDSVTGNLGN